jgi:hypothetical protein
MLCPQHITRQSHTHLLCPHMALKSHKVAVSTTSYKAGSHSRCVYSTLQFEPHSRCVHRMLHTEPHISAVSTECYTQSHTHLLCPQDTQGHTVAVSTPCYTQSHTHLLCPHMTLKSHTVAVSTECYTRQTPHATPHDTHGQRTVRMA